VRDVEDEVNEVLLRDLPVSAFVTSLDEARRLGAMALFGEKYGGEVRVVDVGERDAPYARELCGGTHVAHSAQIGAVTLLSESSVAAGTRRVEGLVGLDAFRFLARERVLLEQVTAAIKATRAEEVPERVNDIVTRLRDAERQLERLRADAVLASAGQLAASAKDVGGVAVVAAKAPEGTGAKDVRTLAVDVRGRLGDQPGVVVIAASADGKVPLVVALTSAAVDRGLTANDILRAATAHVGGSGGGRDPQLAQGAGTDATALAAAFAAVEAAVVGAGR
jgi:alanyl-tRNA synthetase